MFVQPEVDRELQVGEEALYMFKGRINRASRLAGGEIMFVDVELTTSTYRPHEIMRRYREQALSAAAQASGVSLDEIKKQVVQEGKVFIYRPNLAQPRGRE